MIDRITWRYYTLPVLKEENYRWSDSWTSICDIGRIYNGRKFTYKDYKKTEQAYINFIIDVFKYLHVQKIRLIHLDWYKDFPPTPKYDRNGMLREWHSKVANNMSLSLDDIQYVVPLILRENMWGTLYHKQTRTYIRFGYDFYVYVNSPTYYCCDNKVYFNREIERLASKRGLFIDYTYTPTLCKIGKIIKEGQNHSINDEIRKDKIEERIS